MPRDGAIASSLPPAERRLRVLFYLACTALAAWMIFRALHPVRAFQVDRINKDFGLWSLRFLFACLVLSPVSRLARAPSWRRWRRPLGLAAFAFALLHTVHFLLWGRIWPSRMMALLARPYLAIGLVALLLFVPLALTSNDGAERALKPRRWRMLHLVVYPAAALSVLHEVMAYGPLRREAGLYSVLTLLLLAAKGARLIQDRRPAPARMKAPRQTRAPAT